MLEGWALPYTHGREGGCNSAALRWCHGQCLPVMVLQWSAMPGGMEQPSSLCPRHPHPAQRKKYVHCQFRQAIRSHLVTLMNQIKSFVNWQMSKRSQPFKEHHAFCFLSVMNENQHPKLLDLLKAHENAFESPEILEAPRMHYVGYAELAAAVSNGGGLGTANELSNLHHFPLWTIYKLCISIYRICETTNSCNFLDYSCMFTYFLVYSCLSSAGFGHACAMPLPKDSKRYNVFPLWCYN